MKFEEKHKCAYFAMTMDGLVSRAATPDEFREKLKTVVDAWFGVFPNLPGAKAFSANKIFNNPKADNQFIRSLIGVR